MPSADGVAVDLVHLDEPLDHLGPCGHAPGGVDVRGTRGNAAAVAGEAPGEASRRDRAA